MLSTNTLLSLTLSIINALPAPVAILVREPDISESDPGHFGCTKFIRKCPDTFNSAYLSLFVAVMGRSVPMTEVFRHTFWHWVRGAWPVTVTPPCSCCHLHSCCPHVWNAPPEEMTIDKLLLLTIVIKKPDFLESHIPGLYHLNCRLSNCSLFYQTWPMVQCNSAT